MKKIAFAVFVISLSLSSLAEKYHHLSNFEIPEEFLTNVDFHPLGYLETYVIEDETEQLSKLMMEKIGCLFVSSADSVKEKYEQDYLISTQVPIYKLLKHNIPRVVEVEKGGSYAFLGDVAYIIKEEGYCNQQ